MKNIRKKLKLCAIWLQDEILLGRQIRHLYMVLGGHIYFQTLSAAIQFDLFTLLDKEGPMSQEQIERALGIATQPCRILLLGLTALKLTRKRGNLYRNSMIAKRAFSRQSDRNIIDIVRWQHFVNYKALYHFHDSIKANRNTGLAEFAGTEPTLYERLTHDPDMESIFQEAMEQISSQAGQHLAEFLDLGDVHYLVDVGGGNGSNMIQLANANPGLRGGVYDSPSVCEIARQNIASHHLADRLGVFPGDCFKDAFPAEADGLIFCHFFTIWSMERNLQILRRAYEALPPGGRVFIFNMMQNDDRTGPMAAAMGSPYFLTLATGEGMLYTWSEYVDIFRQAGFVEVRTQRLPVSHGVISGRKPLLPSG